MEKKHYVYILACSDGSLYTGYSTDPEKRLLVHNSGRGAKYTKSRRPCKLVYTEELADKSSALRREHEIKKLRRKQKESLVLL